MDEPVFLDCAGNALAGGDCADSRYKGAWRKVPDGVEVRDA